MTLAASWLSTPLGPMLAVADERALLLLEFEGRRGLTASLERLAAGRPVGAGRTEPIDRVEHELGDYFAGNRETFETPLAPEGTEFQRRVWRELSAIPAGSTLSYRELALRVGNPKGVRAVAQANGANRLALVIPCHRVINADGRLGGYGAGLAIKQALLEHERAAFGQAAGRLF